MAAARSLRKVLLGFALVIGTFGAAVYTNQPSRAEKTDGVNYYLTIADTSFVKSPTLSVDEKLDRMGRLSQPLRAAAMRYLSSQQSSDLWRAHTQRWLSSASLTSAQRAVLQHAYDLEVPALYDRKDPRNSQLLIELQGVCQAGESAFADRRLKTAAMVALGNKPGDPLPYLQDVRSRSRSLWDSLVALVIVPVKAEVHCTCQAGGCFSCPPGCGCPGFSGTCDRDDHDCGCSGANDCTAYCANCA